jgi:N-acetyl-gamma-glutamyl-phosphate reductase
MDDINGKCFLSTRVAVAGATGYAGAELAAILSRHRQAEIAALFSSERGKEAPVRVASGEALTAVPFDFDRLVEAEPEVLFLATPNEASAELAPRALDAGIKVIDLSGAFRLARPEMYPSWYGFAHSRPELLDEAVYGLTEWCDGELAAARLVANPGCYPTSILLALRPLAPLLDASQTVVCDSKSGVSGAGKKAELAWSFAEVAGNFKAYGVGSHRHEPEIRQGLGFDDQTPFVFVPHLLPTVRGILSTIHVAFSREVTAEELTALYGQAYAAAPLVRVLPAGALPELKSVVNTPRAEIGFSLLQGAHGGRRAVIVSVIDNLLKGAASQAVQNFNRMYGFAETEGLA